MIERNLGNIERVVRLLLGIAFGVWALLQPQLNGVEWLVMLIALALILTVSSPAATCGMCSMLTPVRKPVPATRLFANDKQWGNICPASVTGSI